MKIRPTRTLGRKVKDSFLNLLFPYRHHLFSRRFGKLKFNVKLTTFKGKLVIVSNGYAATPEHWDNFIENYEDVAKELGYKLKDCIFLFIANSDLSIKISNQNVTLNNLGAPVATNLAQDDRIAELEARGLTVLLFDESEPEEAFKYLVDCQETFGYKFKELFKVGPANILVPGADKTYHNGGKVVYYVIGEHPTSHHTNKAGLDHRFTYKDNTTKKRITLSKAPD